MQTEQLIKEKENRLAIVLQRIERLEAQQNGGYTAQVAKYFHLGTVGGSGRNTARLNKRRENELDKTIDRAKILVQLYGERNALQFQIKDIKEGGPEKRAAAKESALVKLAEYFKNLKAGDFVDIGGNSPALITKKNAKSIETGSGCKWTAAEIIGEKAAQLL